MGSRIWVPHSRFPEGGSWGTPFFLLFRDAINSNQPRFTFRVERPTAPRPILWMPHQSPRHWIPVHVLELFSLLPLRVCVEVVKSRLPQAARSFRLFRKGQPQLFRRNTPPLLA